MAYHLEKIDPNFRADLAESVDYVWMVARWLSDSGYEVEVPVTKIRSKHEPPGKYSDKGDLFIKKPIEVKHRKKLEFSSLDTYPFSDVFVDNANHWDAMRNKPLAYVILNKSATGAIVVPGATSDRWTRETKHLERIGRDKIMLKCPINLCKYIDMKQEILH